MNKLLKFEDGLIRAESWLLVATVITMLVLGSYNVLYRNVLAPWQRDLGTSGPPVAEVPAVAPVEKPRKKDAPTAGGDDADGFGGGFGGDDGAEKAPEDEAGGFGGGFGEEDEAAPEKETPKDEAGGFGGGFGGEDEAAPEKKTPEDEAGGFGGGFGSDDGAEKAPEDEADGFGGGFGSDEGDSDDGFGGGFGDTPKVDKAEAAPSIRAPATATAPPTGGPPPPGSFAATTILVIKAIQFEWIDTLLRQLVIVAGFLGAMIATRRRKHINIDAASKLLPMKVRGWVAMTMNILSTGVSAALAVAGWKLVEIGQAFPKELMPFVEEWHMQVMFPVGFGMVAFHFALRSLEDLNRNLKGLPPVASGETAELENERAQAAAAAGEVN